MKIEEINSKADFSFSAIYLWTNLINNKKYVGQAQNFYERMQDYTSGQEDDRVIGKAILKYGIENFEVTILEKEIQTDRLNEHEQYWMNYYQCFVPNGYNVCHIAGNTTGYRHTEEDKSRMSEIAKQRFKEHPELIKKGKDNNMYGKHHSQETKRKMSESRMGNQNAKGCTWKMKQETKDKISASLKGKQNCLGRKLSQETRNKIAKANRNKIVSEETKKKISKANKGKATKPVRCVETGVVFNSVSEAGEFIGRSVSGIVACCAGKQNTCGSYHWEYVNK